jgi:hypothetical protein
MSASIMRKILSRCDEERRNSSIDDRLSMPFACLCLCCCCCCARHWSLGRRKHDDVPAKSMPSRSRIFISYLLLKSATWTCQLHPVWVGSVGVGHHHLCNVHAGERKQHENRALEIVTNLLWFAAMHCKVG